MNIIFYREYFSDMLNRIPEIMDFEFGTMSQVLSNKIRSTAKYPLLFLERYTTSPDGDDLDNMFDTKYGALVLIDVVADRNRNDETMLASDANTEAIVKKIRESMIADKLAHIQYLSGLNVGSLQYNYVSDIFGGNGWRLSFEFQDSESIFDDSYIVQPSALVLPSEVLLKHTINVGTTVFNHKLNSSLFNVSAQTKDGQALNLNVIARTDKTFTVNSLKKYEDISIILIAARAIL